jgi:dolichol-phosphate mannosyltransferase
MSLGALIRGYSIAQIPIHWSGRTWGSSNLKLREMGRRYLCVLLKTFFEKVLVADDLLAERDARRSPEVAPAADAGDGHLAPGRPARATDLRP